MGQKERNKATEVVDGVVEMASRHQLDVSLAGLRLPGQFSQGCGRAAQDSNGL